jgi:hypothetical protein
MGAPFIGSEAVAAGMASHSQLRRRYVRVFRDVYVSDGTELTPLVRAQAAWLWSRRRGIIAGLTAAALHGAKWIDATRPVDIIHDNRHPMPGLQIWGDRLESDECERIEGVSVTNVARTALDLACWHPTAKAVAAIDALACATDLKRPTWRCWRLGIEAVVALSVLAPRSILSTRAHSRRRRPGCDWS